MAQLDLDGVSVPPERIDAVISKAKNDLVSPEFLARRSGDHIDAVAGKVFGLYQTKLRESSAVDFDDLLGHLVTILKQHPDVRADLDRRFRYVLVDEYQDTNLAQYAIVRGLSADHPNLCVTGDPDQSIYGWRGANLNNILEFEKDFPGAKVVKLEQNYRSTKNILHAADVLIRHNRRRKPKALLTHNPTGSAIELTIYPTQTEEAQGVAARVAEHVREGEFNWGDVAVFCRVTALTRNLEQAFRAAKIPYQVVGGVSFYERQEVKDVLGYLNLMVNPKDDLAFTRVVNVPPRGVGATTLEKLSERAKALELPLLAMARQAANVPGLKDRAVSALCDFGLLMDELNVLREHSAEEVIKRMLGLSGYQHYLESEGKGEGEERLANVLELVSAAREFDRAHPGASVIDFMEDVSLASAVDRWKDGAGAVTLMTLHAAKGLEFPVVFIVGLEQGLLPHSRQRRSRSNGRGTPLAVRRDHPRERELFLSHCRVREFRGSRQVTIPSRFLNELPADVLSIRDLSQSKFAPSVSAFRRPEPPPSPPKLGPGFRLTTAAALQGGSTADDSPVDLSAFRPGVPVRHPQYGLGRIVSIEGAGPDRKGKVAFAVGGEKTFVLSKSPLRPVTRG